MSIVRFISNPLVVERAEVKCWLSEHKAAEYESAFDAAVGCAHDLGIFDRDAFLADRSANRDIPEWIVKLAEEVMGPDTPEVTSLGTHRSQLTRRRSLVMAKKVAKVEPCLHPGRYHTTGRDGVAGGEDGLTIVEPHRQSKSCFARRQGYIVCQFEKKYAHLVQSTLDALNALNEVAS